MESFTVEGKKYTTKHQKHSLHPQKGPINCE